MYKALTLPLLMTLFFHSLLVAAFFFDAPTSEPIVRRAATKYIKAELVTLEKPKQKKKTVKSSSKKKAADRARKLAQQKAEEEQALREKLLQKEQEKQLQLERENEKKVQQKEAQEARQKREQQQRIQQQSERELAEAIAQEKNQQGGDKQVVTAEELANSFIALITDTIQNNWNRPPSARNGMEAQLALTLMPTGEVVNVKVIISSGNLAFDRSAENAVRRAGQFPELKQLPNKVFEDYFRQLRLKFRPEDLRL